MSDPTPSPSAPVTSPPPAPQPPRTEPDPAARFHELARELMHTRSRRALLEYLRLRRGQRA